MSELGSALTNYFVELESEGIGKLVDVKCSDTFFDYIYSHYPWEIFTIDWSKIEGSVCINISQASNNEINAIISKSPLAKYKYIGLFYLPDEPGFVCSFEFLKEHLWSLLRGPGDGYLIGVNEQNNYIKIPEKPDFIEIYAGNWIAWGN